MIAFILLIVVLLILLMILHPRIMRVVLLGVTLIVIAGIIHVLQGMQE